VKNDEKILKDLVVLLDFADAPSMRKSLTEVFFRFLLSNHQVLPHRFEAIASDFFYLLRFIEVLDKHKKN